MKKFHYVSRTPLTTIFLFFCLLTLCKAGAKIRVIDEPTFSVSSGLSTVTLELKNDDKTWKVEARGKGTVKPIENPDGTIQNYSLNDNKSLFVMNTRPATQVNKIVAVLARNGYDSVVLDGVEKKAERCLNAEGFHVDPSRLFARKALTNGLLLYYIPDTPSVAGFSFVLHFDKSGFSVLKSEIAPLS